MSVSIYREYRDGHGRDYKNLTAVCCDGVCYVYGCTTDFVRFTLAHTPAEIAAARADFTGDVMDADAVKQNFREMIVEDEEPLDVMRALREIPEDDRIKYGIDSVFREAVDAVISHVRGAAK